MEEILKSMKADMDKKEQEFNTVLNELKVLEENYTARKKQLLEAKEQIRGAYTALYEQYTKFVKEEDKPTDTPVGAATQTVADKVEEKPVTEIPKKESKPKVTKQVNKTEETKSEEKVVAGLTPEEIAKINKAVTKPNVKDEKGNEIPEYLQPEYNK
jgi:hypothetical protein